MTNLQGVFQCPPPIQIGEIASPIIHAPNLHAQGDSEGEIQKIHVAPTQVKLIVTVINQHNMLHHIESNELSARHLGKPMQDSNPFCFAVSEIQISQMHMNYG